MALSRLFIILSFLIGSNITTFASYIFIPMNEDQTDHLKAYGLDYWVLEQGAETWWLLNYEGGSFVLPNSTSIEKE